MSNTAAAPEAGADPASLRSPMHNLRCTLRKPRSLLRERIMRR
jgi:hypothetical protein